MRACRPRIRRLPRPPSRRPAPGNERITLAGFLEVTLKSHPCLRTVCLTLFACAALLVLSSCQSSKATDGVAARVNGHKIPRSEVDKYYANQTAGSPQQPNGEQSTSL